LGNDCDLDDDNDLLTDLEEAALGTNPLVGDTDGDGFNDGIEVSAGTDPLDPGDFPVSIPATSSPMKFLIVGLLIGAGLSVTRRNRLA
ncbi:MAG: hypothetical protein JRE71_14810, partial [Deltaproteobacteria bacterium]|nr:hypothetical protein [Deltaproteobacteria bacterium]